MGFKVVSKWVSNSRGVLQAIPEKERAKDIKDMDIRKDELPANRNRTYFCSLFLEFFDGSLVNPTAFVNQVASSSGLARVYVSDNDDVKVSLFLSHFVGCEEIFATRCS